MTNAKNQPNKQQPNNVNAERVPCGQLTKIIDGKQFNVHLFFNPDAKETFEDKLMRVIVADIKSQNYNSRPHTIPPKAQQTQNITAHG